MPKDNLDGLIKFRVPLEMQLAFEAAAHLDDRRPADLGRKLIREFLETNAARHLLLKDGPSSGYGLEAAKGFVSVSGEHSRGAASEPPSKEKPGKYPTRRRSKKKPPS